MQHALSAGFTIDEQAQILKERDRGGAPCHEVRELAVAKLEQIEREIEGLLALREEMRSLFKGSDERLARTSKGARAHLLERWSEEPTSHGEAATHTERYGLSGRRRAK